MSAGFGANSTSLIYNPAAWKEYRGQSFSMGGDVGAKSIANFLSHYHSKSDNPDPDSIQSEPDSLFEAPLLFSEVVSSPDIHFDGLGADADNYVSYLGGNVAGGRNDRICSISENSDNRLRFKETPLDIDDSLSPPFYSNVYSCWNPFASNNPLKEAIEEGDKYNHPLGPSKGTRYLRMCLGGWCPPSRWLYSSKIDGLNAAISGSESDALGLQFLYVKERISTLANRSNLNIGDEWKVSFYTNLIFINVDGNCVYWDERYLFFKLPESFS